MNSYYLSHSPFQSVLKVESPRKVSTTRYVLNICLIKTGLTGIPKPGTPSRSPEFSKSILLRLILNQVIPYWSNIGKAYFISTIKNMFFQCLACKEKLNLSPSIAKVTARKQLLSKFRLLLLGKIILLLKTLQSTRKQLFR